MNFIAEFSIKALRLYVNMRLSASVQEVFESQHFLVLFRKMEDGSG